MIKTRKNNYLITLIKCALGSSPFNPKYSVTDMNSEVDKLSINAIRCLSIDAIQAANSGHPGMPMGMAPTAYALWKKHLKHNPSNPDWVNRDRFVLSAGHGSMLLYSLLHLSGYDLSLDEIKNFRQLGSKTPGHPEYGHTSGVEVTTGPLGQGVSNAVGMAIAEKYLAAYFNRDGFPVVDYKVYSIAGDGCLQEGVSSEACSLAGHLGLDNLVVIYDDNKITIDGDTNISFTEDVAGRFEAYGWNVYKVTGDGNDTAGFEKVLEEAKKGNGKPSLICMQTVIGYGSPNKAGSHSVHGAPLGAEEILATKKNLGWPSEEPFFIPEEVKANFDEVKTDGKEAETCWKEMFSRYIDAYPELAKTFQAAQEKTLTAEAEKQFPVFEEGSVATRVASGKVLNAVMPVLPMVMGGSADLTPSNNTWFEGAVDFQKDSNQGRYIRYGVREHAMGAIMNGISISGLTRAYGATFFSFADYMRPAIRVAALSGYPAVFVFTHDSIGLGEDGPTHQPVEHLASLRAMPGLVTFRPADANETAMAWKYALTQDKKPVALALTRQGLPVLPPSKYDVDKVEKGAYVLESAENPELILMASGSEVSLILEAYETLTAKGLKVRAVSMPSWELFNEQSQEYKNSVLPETVKSRVAVEAGVRLGWEQYLGFEGAFIGMEGFGASAPANKLFEHFGITVDQIVETSLKMME